MVSEHHPQIRLYYRKPSWCVYSEEQRSYPDLSDEDHVLVDSIQCDMAAGSFAMNGCVCMLNKSVDVCLLEGYLTLSQCYLPFKCCCYLLEKSLDITTLRTIHPVARVK